MFSFLVSLQGMNRPEGFLADITLSFGGHGYSRFLFTPWIDIVHWDLLYIKFSAYFVLIWVCCVVVLHTLAKLKQGRECRGQQGGRFKGISCISIMC